jgi:hypothetical protein
LVGWWLTSRKKVHKETRGKASHVFTVLFWWLVWKERNNQVFNNVWLQAARLASLISQEGRLWTAAGFLSLSDFVR